MEYEIIYGNAERFLRPHFQFPIYNVSILNENWPHAGDRIAQIQATSSNKSTIRYELYSYSSKMDDYFSINPETGKFELFRKR